MSVLMGIDEAYRTADLPTLGQRTEDYHGLGVDRVLDVSIGEVNQEIEYAIKQFAQKKGAGLTWDEKNTITKKHISRLADSMQLNNRERNALFGRLYSFRNVAYFAENARRQSENLNYPLPAEYIFDERFLLEYDFIFSWRLSRQLDMREVGVINRLFIPIPPLEAHAVSVGTLMILRREGIATPTRVLELGAGDGQWGLLWSQLGIPTVGIEMDILLAIVEHEKKVEHLHRMGFSTDNYRMINERFNKHAGENSTVVNHALTESSLWLSYPWSNEVPGFLELFDHFAPEGAILVMYGGANENGQELEIEKKELKKHPHLQPVGIELREHIASLADDQLLGGYSSGAYGCKYVVFEKNKLVTSDRLFH